MSTPSSVVPCVVPRAVPLTVKFPSRSIFWREMRTEPLPWVLKLALAAVMVGVADSLLLVKTISPAWPVAVVMFNGPVDAVITGAKVAPCPKSVS